MQIINKAWLEIFPEEFHNRLIRDDNSEYWVSCQLRSGIINNDDNFYPMKALVVIENYSITDDGTIIYEDLT